MLYFEVVAGLDPLLSWCGGCGLTVAGVALWSRTRMLEWAFSPTPPAVASHQASCLIAQLGPSLPCTTHRTAHPVFTLAHISCSGLQHFSLFIHSHLAVLSAMHPGPTGLTMCGDCNTLTGAVLLFLQVNCELDRAGLGSLTFNAIEFSCPVDQDKEPNIQVGMHNEPLLLPRLVCRTACSPFPMLMHAYLAGSQHAHLLGMRQLCTTTHGHGALQLFVSNSPCSVTGTTCATSCLVVHGIPPSASWPPGAPASEASHCSVQRPSDFRQGRHPAMPVGCPTGR